MKDLETMMGNVNKKAVSSNQVTLDLISSIEIQSLINKASQENEITELKSVVEKMSVELKADK
jgi:hypothetical protein